MAQKFVGLDLGTQEVKAALISAGLRAAQVLEVHEEPVVRGPQGDDSLAAALDVARSVLRQRGWQHYPIGIVLPGGVGYYRVLRFPFGDARRIAQAINFEIEGQFPVPVESLEVDHFVIGGTKAIGAALVAAAPRALVQQIVEAFAADKVEIKAIMPPPLAIAQAIDAPIPPVADGDPEHPRAPAALIVDIGHKHTELIAVGAKGPIAARSLRRGAHHITKAVQLAFGVNSQAAEALKIQSGVLPSAEVGELEPEQARLASILAGAYEPILLEIEHTRLWLRSELGCEVTVLWIAGGGAKQRGCRAFFSERSGLPVAPAAPHEGGLLRRVTSRDWSAATGAIGGALAASRRPLIQLYKQGRAQAEGGWLSQKIPSIAAIGLGLMAFGALDTVAKVRAYEAAEAAYAAELGQLTKAVFGAEELDVDALRGRLAAVGGRDLSTLVASRSAVDVLAAIVKVATPKGPRPAQSPEAAPSSEPDGEDSAPAAVIGVTAPPSAFANPSAPTTTGTASAAAAPDPNAGLSWEDDLLLQTVEIRRQKIDITASATRLSAQSRLKRRLQTISCITNIQEGRARDESDRKVFEMSIEHDCLYKPLEEDA
ncbi:MAG: pilus assembly protein PilM [Nannocystis sp.]|nr:pilus assembly protein PilM [Nannocystis sp.]